MLPRHRHRHRRRRGPAALLAAIGLACGVPVQPQIADEFYERLHAPPVGWTPVPCPDREAKVPVAWQVVHFAHDLRAQLREFDTPLPPRLQMRLEQTDLLGTAAVVRCVMHDFARIDLDTDPDAQDVVGNISNLYVLAARTRFDDGDAPGGWAHMLEALTLYGEPVGPSVAKQLTLRPVLDAMHDMLKEHPVPPQTTEQLVAAVDATRVPPAVQCAALRHELLAIAVGALRGHFDQREREAMARRFGLDFAMRAWRQHPAGQQDRAVWDAIRDAYDAQVPECGRRPYGLTVQAAATAQSRIDLQHPPTGVLVRLASDRLNRAAGLVDAQVTMLALLRAMALRQSSGRMPTTAQLALDFGRRPRNPWDGRYFTVTVLGETITIERGSYRRDLRLPAALE
ncbi:MAG: hypothetical protein AB1Z98_11465 [Nannocystaceae bacterium]